MRKILLVKLNILSTHFEKRSSFAEFLKQLVFIYRSFVRRGITIFLDGQIV